MEVVSEIFWSVLDLVMVFRPFLGFLTLAISFWGTVVSLAHAHYWSRSKDPFAIKMKHLFWSDAGIFIMTALFGLGAMIALPLEVRNFFQLLREPVLIAQILASMRLSRHVKEIR